MRPTILLLALGLFVTVSACSGNAKDSFRNVDHDGDGKITYEELLFVFPGLSPRTFHQLDLDGDGFISQEEYTRFLQESEASKNQPSGQTGDHQPKASTTTPRATDTRQPAIPFKGEKVIEIAPPARTTPSTAKKKPSPPPATVSKSSAAEAPSGRRYTVVRGDNLSKIAHRFGVSVEAITRANGNMSPDVLRDGQELVIPPRP